MKLCVILGDVTIPIITGNIGREKEYNTVVFLEKMEKAKAIIAKAGLSSMKQAAGELSKRIE